MLHICGECECVYVCVKTFFSFFFTTEISAIQITKFLNRADVQEDLGVNRTWEACNSTIRAKVTYYWDLRNCPD